MTASSTRGFACRADAPPISARTPGLAEIRMKKAQCSALESTERGSEIVESCTISPAAIGPKWTSGTGPAGGRLRAQSPARAKCRAI